MWNTPDVRLRMQAPKGGMAELGAFRSSRRAHLHVAHVRSTMPSDIIENRGFPAFSTISGIGADSLHPRPFASKAVRELDVRLSLAGLPALPPRALTPYSASCGQGNLMRIGLGLRWPAGKRRVPVKSGRCAVTFGT